MMEDKVKTVLFNGPTQAIFFVIHLLLHLALYITILAIEFLSILCN